jgi:hypothetical protein
MGDNLPSKTFILVCTVSFKKNTKLAILAKRINDKLKLYVARYNEVFERIIANIQSDPTSNSPPVKSIVIQNPIIIDHNTGQQQFPVIPSNLAPEHPQVVIIEMPKLDSESSFESGVKDTINTLLRTTQEGPEAAVTIDENEEQFQHMIVAITNFLKENKKGGNKQSRSFRNSSSRSSHRRASSRSSKKRTTKRNLKRRQRSAYRRRR